MLCRQQRTRFGERVHVTIVWVNEQVNAVAGVTLAYSAGKRSCARPCSVSGVSKFARFEHACINIGTVAYTHTAPHTNTGPSRSAIRLASSLMASLEA